MAAKDQVGRLASTGGWSECLLLSVGSSSRFSTVSQPTEMICHVYIPSYRCCPDEPLHPPSIPLPRPGHLDLILMTFSSSILLFLPPRLSSRRPCVPVYAERPLLCAPLRLLEVCARDRLPSYDIEYCLPRAEISIGNTSYRRVGDLVGCRAECQYGSELGSASES
jgi:hypothetical protein